jgi:hypothetical protein
MQLIKGGIFKFIGRAKGFPGNANNRRNLLSLVSAFVFIVTVLLDLPLSFAGLSSLHSP